MSMRNMPIVDWLSIEASSPAKFIISGEYSVVYKKQAVAAAIDLRTTVVIKPNKDGMVKLTLKNLNNVREWPTSSMTMCRLITKYSDCLEFDVPMKLKLAHLLHSKFQETLDPTKKERGDDDKAKKDLEKKADDAAMAFLLLYIGLGDSYASAARPSLDVTVESNIPVGSGLGSSSAYSVALCGALMRVYRVVAEKYIISDWALNIDKFFHGRPSGVDNNIVNNGGILLFQEGKIKATAPKYSNPIRVLLIDTCVSRSTRELSEGVVQQMQDDPNRINNLFNSINELTTHIWRKISDANFTPSSISVYLQANQEMLNDLGVGHEKLQDICMRARRLELTAKQTGAGGGGTAFVLYDEKNNGDTIRQLRNELLEAGYEVHDQAIGCEGLLVNVTLDPDKQFNLGDN